MVNLQTAHVAVFHIIIIVSYKSHSLLIGSVTSAEVQGLMSGARYYFKMGACTEVGVGPYSPVKDVYTPPKKYGVYVYVEVFTLFV